MQSLVNHNAIHEELPVAANDANALATTIDTIVTAKGIIPACAAKILYVATEFNNETYDITKKTAYPIFRY